MKKKLLLFSAGLFFTTFGSVNAQVSAYTFSQSSTTYTPITGGSVVGTTTDDGGVYGALAIGFSFTYNGTAYTQFGINANGWINLGGTTPTNSSVPISNTSTNNLIAAMGADLVGGFRFNADRTTGSNILSNATNTAGLTVGSPITGTGIPAGTTVVAIGAGNVMMSANATSTATGGQVNAQNGEMRYETIGTAPNRTLVVQWSRFRRFGSTNDVYNFQIRLNETTNVIDIIYDATGGTTTTTLQIGLKGASNADFNNRTTTTNWLTTTAGATNTSTVTISSTINPPSGLVFTWSPPPPCSGTPTAGTAISSVANACSGVNFTLSATGTTTGVTGLTYQWQSSTDGVSYGNISGATNATLVTSQIDTTYYQLVVTCSTSGLSSNSTPVQVNMNPFYMCYCASNATNTADTKIDSVKIGTISTGSAASTCQTYTDYRPMSTNMTIGQNQTLKVRNGSCSGSHFGAYVSVYIDYNQDGDFTDAGETVATFGQTTALNSIPTLNFTPPFTATPGLTGMRIVLREGTSAPPSCGTYTYGETEDYLVNLIMPAGCTATPTPGTTVASSNPVCSGVNFTLSLSGASTDAGITYQWQSSPDGVTYSNISGATNTTLVTSVTDTTWFQAVLTCTNTSTSATSTPVQVNLNNFYNCYCTTSFATNSADTKIDSVLIGTIATGSAASTCQTYTDYRPMSTNLQQTVSSNIRIRNGSCSGSHFTAYTSVFIDYNHDGDFTDAGETVATYGPTTGLNTIPTLTFTPPMTALTGLTGMRIVFREGSSAPPSCGSYSYGETEDYLVNILAAPPCVTPPVGGTISGPTNDTINQAGTYTLTGSTGNIQWQHATNIAGPYTNISGATSATLNYTFTTTGNHFFIAILSNPGCTNDTSNVFTTNVIFPGDNICNAIPIVFGTNGPYNLNGATVQTGEAAPPATGCQTQTGWCNSTLANTMWFTFTAPASGRVILQTPSFDSQLALWSAPNCSALTSGGGTLIAANDDDPQSATHGGVTFSSYIGIVNCLTPGQTYYVQFDSYGTGGTSSLILTDPGFVDTSFSGLDTAYCLDAPAATLTPVTTGGTFAGPGVTGTTFNPAAAGVGTHTVTYTLNGCYTETKTVNVRPLPTVNLGADFTTCGSATLDAGNVGSTYAWSTAETTQMITITATGPYSVVTLNNFGCDDEDTVTVTVNPNPDVDLGPDTLICGTTATLDAGAGFSTYLWSTAETTQTITTSMDGQFIVDVTDENGCPDSDTINVFFAPNPVVDLGPDTIVCGGPLTLDAADGTSWNWSTGDLTQTISVTTTGTYAVTASYSTGCSDADTINVTVNPAPSVNLGPDVTLCDTVYMLDAGNPGDNYLWSTLATTQTINVTSSDTVSVEVSNSFGCSDQDTVVVILNTPAVADAGDDVTVCTGASANLNTGPGFTSYLWSDGDVFFVSSQNTMYTPAAAGVYPIYLEVVAANGCTDIDLMTVTAVDAPVAGYNFTTTGVGVISFTNTSTPATGLTYNWNFGDATTSTLADPTHTYTANGNYTVTLIVTNACTSDTITKQIFVTGIGITEQMNGQTMIVYPNPANEFINVKAEGFVNGNGKLSVYDASGRIVYNTNMSSDFITIDLTALEAGMYIIELKSDNYNSKSRFTLAK